MNSFCQGGATWVPKHGGTSFSIFAHNATRVELCLFDDPDGTERRTDLAELTEHTWQGFVPDVQPGQHYGFRVHGPYEPENGQRFNPAKLLIDPYARAIAGRVNWQEPVFAYRLGSEQADLELDQQDSARGVPKSVVVDPSFDWGDDHSPDIPWSNTIIYEAHVKGLTARHPHVPETQRGTYAGVASPAVIEHLQRLGITSLELLPVHHFIDDSYLIDKGLTNYWGYNSIGYFAPEARYSASGQHGEQVAEFKQMVKALHAADIEVILDVVYNHTAEGNHLGPTLCLRGVDNRIYYNLMEDNRRFYRDFTGTGNTLNVGHSQTLKLIADSLRLWVQEYHVDGFRFDLAITLARDPGVGYDKGASFFDILYQDPVLSRVKLIAEPWDIGDFGYQVGNFPPIWSEWNGKYRDTVRRFWKGDEGQLTDLARRLVGSPDLYQKDGRGPRASINFVTAHDGFTLRDLVSYNEKHNEANGENNKDGTDDNASWNCGAEGETDAAEIRSLRVQQQRNFLTTLLVSQGVPMIVHGDELGRTQGGNNNAYCQDNEVAWIDWELDDERQALVTFVQQLIAVRKQYPVLRRTKFATGEGNDPPGVADLAWFQADGQAVSAGQWSDPHARSLGMRLVDQGDESRAPTCLLALINAYWEEVPFVLPPTGPHATGWKVVIDTHAGTEPPAEREPQAANTTYALGARSIVVLVGCC